MTQAKQMTLSMESMDAYMSLFGLNDQNVAVVEQECNVHVALRGNELIVSGDAENVELAVAVMEKPRDMKDYHVPEDMNVAINKEALDEVVQELGSNQPAFMKRMIEELKGKWSVCCKQTQFLGDYVP